MTPYKLTVLKLEEIKDCTVRCTKCSATVTVPLDRIDSLQNSNQCPSCKEDYDNSLIKSLAGLRQAHTHASDSKFTIEFHIIESEVIPSRRQDESTKTNQ